MRRFALFVVCFAAIVLLGVSLPHSHRHVHAAAAAQAGNWQNGDCDKNGNQWGEARVCQMRRTTFALPSGRISVNTMNGGIDITGEDRSDVALEARVSAWAPSESEASDLLSQVVIDTDNGDIRDHGPHSHFLSRTGYSVDYHLHVPRHLAADLHTMNGGIDLTRVDGNLRFGTTNGGVSLDHVSGDVEGHTINGGLNVSLDGNGWQGSGLHADTTNGGIDLRVPEHYNAHLETATVNGGISVDFPVTVQGTIKNRLYTDLGAGGPTVHVQTVNGGVNISHNDTSSAD
jgi:Putative adhesin